MMTGDEARRLSGKAEQEKPHGQTGYTWGQLIRDAYVGKNKELIDARVKDCITALLPKVRAERKCKQA
jgi:hypothetical protein